MIMSSAPAGRLVFAFNLFLLLLSSPTASAKYEENDRVTLWVSKVGPYHNPQEAYDYHSLPFCLAAGNVTQKFTRFADVLGGYMLVDSQFDIKFKRKVDRTSICQLQLDAAMVKQYKNVIDKLYFLELFMDDLPLWGFIGEVWQLSEHEKYHIYTHKNFDISYNSDQIIGVNFTQESPKQIEAGMVLNLTYAVKWIPTHINYADRFDVYLDHPFFKLQTQWSSFSHPLLVVILLGGLVSVILMRTLCYDDTKNANQDVDLETMERFVSEESRWKLVYADVFRPPQNILLLSALVGTGAQLMLLVLLAMMLKIMGMLHVERGGLSAIFLFSYAVTSIMAGYVSTAVYSRCGGENWIKVMMFTLLSFPFVCFGFGFILNAVASFCGLLAAVPSETMVVVFAIWAVVSLPLGVIGTIVGRRWSSAPNEPCIVNKIPRPIPLQKWYCTPSVISLVGGLLPFGSIFIELSFLFASFWKYKVYYSYDVLLLFFLILILVTACVSIVGTYLLLNDENYLWQWTAFMSCASVSIYIYLYSIYYFYMKTSMDGLFQSIYYFGCTLIFSLALGLLCGAVGYLASTLFVWRIYRNVKGD